MPGEYELAEQFGVNRSTVREALSILKTLRVIDIRKGEGTFINETEIKQELDIRLLALAGPDQP